MTGSGVLAGKSETGARTAYDIRDLHLAERRAADRRRRSSPSPTGGAASASATCSVTLKDLDLDAARAYVDSLPFFGTLSGTLAGAGFLDAMDVDDRLGLRRRAGAGRAGVPDRGEGHRRRRPRDSGLTFTNFEVRRSDIDLRTVRRLAPAVILAGPARGGRHARRPAPQRDLPRHRAAAGRRPPAQHGHRHPPSRHPARLARARDRRHLRSALVRGDPPRLPHAQVQGRPPRPVPERGHAEPARRGRRPHRRPRRRPRARASSRCCRRKWGAEDLLLRFPAPQPRRADGQDARRPRWPASSGPPGSIDTLRAPEGDLELALTRSRIREWTIDSLFGRGSVHDSVIRVDTAYAEWQGARASGGGTLGWRAPHDGRDALRPRGRQPDRLRLAAARGHPAEARHRPPTPGRSAAARPAGWTWPAVSTRSRPAPASRSTASSGSGSARRRLTGSVNLARRPAAADHRARGRGHASGSSSGCSDGTAGSVDRVRRLARRGAPAPTSARRPGFDAAGRWYSRRLAPARLGGHAAGQARGAADTGWRQPVMVALADSAPAVSPLSPRRARRLQRARRCRQVPGQGARRPSACSCSASTCTTSTGCSSATRSAWPARSSSTSRSAARPRRRRSAGIARLADGRFGDFQSPFVQGVLNYGDRRLDANLDLWRTGENLLQVEAHLPLDLGAHRRREAADRRPALGPGAHRQRVARTARGHHPGGHRASAARSRPTCRSRAPGRGRGSRAASTPAAAACRSRGSACASAASRAAPSLDGRLGASSTTCCSRAAAAGSRWGARCGWRTSRGRCSTSTSRPTSSARSTCAASSPSSAPAISQLRGPVFGATLTGSLLANSGVLYFADLVNKRIIDLEDPSIADLVDTTLIRRENLGAKFQNRFLDSPPDRRPAGGDGLGRLAPLRRGEHPAGRPRAGEQDGRRRTTRSAR